MTNRYGMTDAYGIIFNDIRDMDGHYCATKRVPDFPLGTIELAQAEITMLNEGRCTKDRCPGCPKTHTGFYSVSRQRVSQGHADIHVAKGRYEPECQYCNPDGYRAVKEQRDRADDEAAIIGDF